MDHKVSKDMISSGMIPSGEKTQADLGRIQYGSAPSPSSLMDAYKSMYEHHKKDADGNTIPHEGEELNEIISPAVQLGARKLASTAAKRGIGTAVKKAAGMAAKPLAGKTGLKAVGMAAKTLSKPGVRQGLKKAAGTAAKVGAIGATGYALGRAAQDKPSSGFNSYVDMNFHYVPDGDTLSEDLFDALKSALIEEGYDEKSVMKIMASVTPDLINEVVENYKKQENLDEIAPLALALPALAKGAAALLAKKAVVGGALKAGALAAKGAVKKGVIGATKMAMKKGTTAGATKLVGRVGTQKAAGMVAKKAAVGAGKAMVKNPVNTALAGSMMMPQGGAPKPEAAQRGVTSGKRTAGMQRMDLDLFDIVKGQLLDEGLTEEECNDVMTTLTLEEINETLQLDEISGKLAMKASRAADMKRAQLAKAGNKAGAAAKAAQATRLYQGGAKRNIASTDYSKPLNPQRKDYPMGKGGSYQQKPGM